MTELGRRVASMKNRRIGLVVVVIALLVAVILPAALGRTIPGVAQAARVPGPPAVGQCVGQKFDIGRVMIGTDPSRYSYPELVPGDCSQPHYGEVIAVIARPTKVKIDVQPDGGGFSIEDQNMEACSAAAASFLGLGSTGSRVLFGYWSSTFSSPGVPMTPTARQRAAGQHWLACAIYLTEQPDSQGAQVVRYDGSLRNARSTGAGRNYLGYCPTDSDWNQATSPNCLRPHHGEIFGTGGLWDDVPRTTLTESCAKLVEQATGSTDVLKNSRLMVSVQATDISGNTITGATIPENSSLLCGVVTRGADLLKGSLIAIGNEPIPWA